MLCILRKIQSYTGIGPFKWTFIRSLRCEVKGWVSPARGLHGDLGSTCCLFLLGTAPHKGKGTDPSLEDETLKTGSGADTYV